MTQAKHGGVVALPDENKVVEVQGYLRKLAPAIAGTLPKGMDAERVTRIAMTLVRQSAIQAHKDNKPGNSLAVCSVESFAGSLLTASALGLEPGVNQEAYLVPYKRECTLIIGYQGYTKMFWQHPRAEHLDAHAVHERDEFDYAYGRDPYLHHKPARGPRGDVIFYWAGGQLTGGAFRFIVLTPDEVKALRGGKEGPQGNIADPQRWMERKTALRQVLKLMPKSTTLSAALVVDEQRGSVLAERAVPAAIAEQMPIPDLPPVQAAPAEEPDRVTREEITVRGPAHKPTDPPAESEPAAEGEPKARRAQVTAIRTTFADLGVTDRTERLTATGLIAGREIKTSTELTDMQARKVLTELARISELEDKQTALGVYLAELAEAGA